ncbi:hypothetical protein, partial [Nocardia brasiliensis]|uniref:hypothetical protein n=1 Tax=Nocardia brasiliensis TaxID=37326 RepID=UPI002453F25A
RRELSAASQLDASAVPRLAVSAVCEYLDRPDDGLFVTVDSGIPAGRAPVVRGAPGFGFAAVGPITPRPARGVRGGGPGVLQRAASDSPM